jgi:fructose-1,6-bisphosphatase/sedoheptulose 1,7-bisphosphatase-like protein
MKKLLVTPEGEQLIDLTNEESIRYENDLIQAEQFKITEQNRIAQEKARKESAIAKLKALGLTEEEVKSIL